MAYVVYWPTTPPGCQNRKCTYVNNRCIRLRNIRIILYIGWVEWVQLWCPQDERGVKLLYNSVKTGSQLFWRPNQLETRCSRESQHSAEGALGTPDWAVWRPDPLVTRCGRESQHSAEWAPRPPVEQTRKETLMAIRVGINMLQFWSVSNFLSHTTLSNKVRGIFFEELCRSYLLLCCYVYASASEYITHINHCRLFNAKAILLEEQ